MRTLVIKTGALGDVLRSTSILPGLAERHPDLDVTWVTAHAARSLVEHHRLARAEDLHQGRKMAARGRGDDEEACVRR